MTALYKGRWPTHDAFGNEYTRGADKERADTDLADGYFGVTWSFNNDLDFAAKEMELANYRKLNSNPCNHCPCNQSTLPWDDLKPTAAWVSNSFSVDAWRAFYKNLIELFNVPGVNVLCLGVDIMHVKHMGSDMYFYGSVLYMLVYEILTDRPFANLQEVFSLIKKYYVANATPTRYENMTLSMIVGDVQNPQNKYPKLKGRASEVRHLGGALLEVWERFMDRGGGEAGTLHKKVRLGLRMSVCIENVLTRCKHHYKLEGDDLSEYEKAIWGFLSVQNSLAHDMVRAKKKLFNVTIKSHCLGHSALRAGFINPVLEWCYGGESMMHTTKTLAASCVARSPPSGMYEKFWIKYRCGVHMKADAL